jgi:hypothetical protein
MLEATYAGSPSKPTRPATEEQLTMVPLPCYKHFSNFMLHAEPNPFQVYGNGFIPIFLCTISRGAESFNTGIVKGIVQSPKSSYGFFDHAFTSALFETSHLKNSLRLSL